MSTVASVHPLLIKASAGTGKTRALSNRYLYLLLSGEKLDRILAMTFTRKAAYEIKHRIVRRLADAAIDSRSCNTLGEELGLSTLNTAFLEEKLQYVMENLQRLEVCTFDSFVSKIVSSYSYELGLRPGWSIADVAQQQRISELALAAVCKEVSPETLAALLSLVAKDRWKRSLAYDLHTVLHSLYDIYQESSIEAWNWLDPSVEDFPVESSDELLETLRAIDIPKTQKGTPNKVWQNAINNMCVLLQENRYRPLLEHSLVQKILFDEERFARHPIPESARGTLTRLLEFLKGVLLQQHFQRGRALHALSALYARSSEDLQKKENAYSFTGLKRLFQDVQLHDVLQDVFYRIDCQISHILLDEFQDTSMYEWKVIEGLVAEILSKESGETSFFCVGDVKQAIYGWRGGVAEIFSELTQRWPHITEEHFDKSYRCSATVLASVNRVFSMLNDFEGLSTFPEVQTAWRGRFSEHVPAIDHEGFVKFLAGEQTECVATSIEQLLAEVHSALRNSSDITIGVLLRRNVDVVACVQRIRESYPDVQVSQEGGTPLSDFPLVNVLISFLRVIDFPGDSVAWLHVLTSPLDAFLGIDRSASFAARIRCVEKLRLRLQQEGIAGLLSAALHTLQAHLGAEEKRLARKVQVLANTFVTDSSLRTAPFIEYVSSQRYENAQEAQIRVMTIHQSKGLEFDAVLLPDLQIDLRGQANAIANVLRTSALTPPTRICLASNRSERALIPELNEAFHFEQASQVSESLSLLYVAMTRARYALLAVVAPEGDGSCTFSEIFHHAYGFQNLPYVAGDEQWYRQVEETTVSLETRAVPAGISLRPPSQQKRNFLRSRPSSKAQVVVSDTVFPTMVMAAQQGTAVHMMLQKIIWLENEEKFCARMFDSAVEDGSEELSQSLCKELNNPEIRRIFLKSEYASPSVKRWEVRNEHRFAILDDSVVSAGAIDRLVLGFNEDEKAVFCEIIDFKTDTFLVETALQDKVSQYRQQLQLYERAVMKSFNVSLESIRKRLVFVSEGVVVEVGSQ